MKTLKLISLRVTEQGGFDEDDFYKKEKSVPNQELFLKRLVRSVPLGAKCDWADEFIKRAFEGRAEY